MFIHYWSYLSLITFSGHDFYIYILERYFIGYRVQYFLLRSYIIFSPSLYFHNLRHVGNCNVPLALTFYHLHYLCACPPYQITSSVMTPVPWGHYGLTQSPFHICSLPPMRATHLFSALNVVTTHQLSNRGPERGLRAWGVYKPGIFHYFTSLHSRHHLSSRTYSLRPPAASNISPESTIIPFCQLIWLIPKLSLIAQA